MRDEETVQVRASEMLDAWRQLLRVAYDAGIGEETLAVACLAHFALTTISDYKAGNLAALEDAIRDLDATIAGLAQEVEKLEAEHAGLIVPPTKRVM